MSEEIIEEIDAYKESLDLLIRQRDAARSKVRALSRQLDGAISEIARLERERVVLVRKARPWWRRLFS